MKLFYGLLHPVRLGSFSLPLCFELFSYVILHSNIAFFGLSILQQILSLESNPEEIDNTVQQIFSLNKTQEQTDVL